MLRMARAGQMFSRTVMQLACGTLGIFGLALLVTASFGVDTDRPANGSQTAPQDKPMDEPEEALAGFNNTTNGFEDQDAFDDDRRQFEEVETILPQKASAGQGGSSGSQEGSHGGLGPVYNATSCVSCHQNPVTGSSSQVSELRAGHLENGNFVEPPGGSLVHQRAIDAAIQEHVREQDNIRTLRMSTNTLGNGFVECIRDEDIKAVQTKQPDDLRGTIVWVPVVIKEIVKDGEIQDFEFQVRIGRFGWKDQEASLLNFAAGAYLNEMGITSPLQPKENTSGGRDVSQFDQVPDPEDPAVPDPDHPGQFLHPFGNDVEAFTRFMRSTRVPPRDFTLAGLDDVKEGERLFTEIGCAVCHVPQWRTAPVGTTIRGDQGIAKVPKALGNKKIHPFSDFLLHDVGTGDGIVQTQHPQRPPHGLTPARWKTLSADIKGTGQTYVEVARDTGVQRTLKGADTANKIRTAPLWGLRVRPQLMHDGLSLTLEDAIGRHQGQAKGVTQKFRELEQKKKEQVKAFLRSL